MNKKISVIGAGNVGATTAQRLFEKNYSEVALIDIAEGIAEGKALDILQSGPVLGLDNYINGSTNYDITKNSDIIVITSGIARKPGMSRDDLLKINMNIVSEVTEKSLDASPDALVIVVTNPLDAMAMQSYKVSGKKPNEVFGMAGVLDSARFTTFISQSQNTSVKSISSNVLGGHGDTMVPLLNNSFIGGKSLSESIKEDELNDLVDRTKNGGAEIVNYLKTGSAFYAPSASIVQMVDAISSDSKEVLPTTAYLQGEYGINDLYFGVPAKLGKNGVEEIIQYDLSDAEKEDLNKSAKAVKDTVIAMENLS
jgi:malate dehydrogenase|tara:strand:+ start:426 stop:1358 length:933 start_codon:yes stop_codon:yes gene_type:complete